MMKKAEQLLNKIVVTSNMLEYNVGNILRGDYNITDDPYIRKNRDNLCFKDEVSNTILGIYFRNKVIRKKLHVPGYSGIILKHSIEKYIKINFDNLILPDDDEVVVYFRLGDNLKHSFNMGRKLFFDYKNQINNKIKKGHYKKITIVTNFSFCSDDKHQELMTDEVKKGIFYNSFQKKGTCEYSKENIDFNRQTFLPILDDIVKTYSNYEVDIFSNENPDHDICYLYKNGFIGDSRATWYKIFNYNR